MTASAWLWCACGAAELGALVAAVRAHRLGRVQLALVYLLAFAFDGDLVIALGRELLLDAAPRPFVGLARAWYHLETLLVIGWPCGLALTCVRVFGTGGRAWWRGVLPAAVAGAAGSAMVHVVALHPVPRGQAAAVLLAVELVGVVVAWLAVARGWALAWRAEHRALVVLVAIETVVLILGPFGHDVFTSWATLARVPYAMGFTVCAVVLARQEDAS